MATTTLGIGRTRPTGLLGRLRAWLHRDRGDARRIEDLGDAELLDIGIEPHMIARIQELRHWSSPHHRQPGAWTELMLRPPYG